MQAAEKGYGRLQFPHFQTKLAVAFLPPETSCSSYMPNVGATWNSAEGLELVEQKKQAWRFRERADTAVERDVFGVGFAAACALNLQA